MNTNMKAVLLLHERHQLRANAFVEIRVWQTPAAVRGSAHRLKYALAYVVAGSCIVRYDNEAGKGDHKHVGMREYTYRFTTLDQLLGDFWSDIEKWRP
jgi:hypothetical protein